MRFTEKQQFPDWLRYGVLIFIVILTYVLTKADTVNQPLFLILLACLLLPALIFFWTLETEVDSKNIYIRIKPFMNKKIPFDEIQSWTVRTYKPIREYGGWGIRWGPKGTAYNIKGDQGLQLVLINGKRILVGTQRQQELARVMRSALADKEQLDES